MYHKEFESFISTTTDATHFIVTVTTVEQTTIRSSPIPIGMFDHVSTSIGESVDGHTSVTVWNRDDKVLISVPSARVHNVRFDFKK